MLHALRSRSALVVIAAVVLGGGSVRWIASRNLANPEFQIASLVDFSGTSPALAAQPDEAASQPTDGAVRIEYRGEIGDLYYYVIENDITDDVAIITQMFRLPSSTTFKDERTIIQSIAPVRAPAAQPVRPNLPPPPPPVKNDALVHFEWAVDRYKASEVVTDMAEVAFDSLKHTHPPRELSGLAKVDQSKIGFQLDGRTGAASSILIQPGPGAHPTDSRQSKTAENGLVTTENMQELLYAMGEQFLPGSPRKVGDQWEVKRVRLQPPFGTVTTVVTCKFKSLDRVGNADIASIDLTSVNFFEPSPVKPPPAAPPVAPPVALPLPTTRPTTTSPHYPIAPRTPVPYKPTTRPFAPPTTRPTSHPAVRFPVPPNSETTSSTTKPAAAMPSMGEFDPGPVPPHQDKSMQKPADSQPAAAANAAGESAASPIIPIAQSRPVDDGVPTTMPAPLPVATQPGKPTEEPFQMKSAHFSGTVKFDVTHGRLVELVLRSNQAFSKVMRSDKEEMEIKQGTRSTLKVKGSTTPPLKPNIPGGKKPPVEKPPPNARPTVQSNTTSRPVQNGTTQPAAGGLARPIGAATTQPNVSRISTSPAIMPPKQSPVLSKSMPPRGATSHPVGAAATSQPVE